MVTGIPHAELMCRMVTVGIPHALPSRLSLMCRMVTVGIPHALPPRLSFHSGNCSRLTTDGMNQEDAADALCGIGYGLIHTEHYDEGVKTFKQVCASLVNSHSTDHQPLTQKST